MEDSFLMQITWIDDVVSDRLVLYGKEKNAVSKGDHLVCVKGNSEIGRFVVDNVGISKDYTAVCINRVNDVKFALGMKLYKT